MTLNVSGFPACCGAVVLQNFLENSAILDTSNKRSVEEQERQLKNLFRSNPYEDTGPCLINVGFVHVTLNHYQTLNEIYLFEHGFQKVSSETWNDNTGNSLSHYIRVASVEPSKISLSQSRFKNTVVR